MKKVLPIILIFLFHVWISAQVCAEYYPLKTGNSWEVSHYNKKDKLESITTSSVKSVNEFPNGYEAIVTTSSIDEKGKTQGSVDLTMKCVNGVFFFDMKDFLKQSNMEETPDMNVTMTATDLEFPATLTVGATLPDANISYQMSTNGMVVMTMSVTITDRKIIGQESITTPAGTFNVWKITSKSQSKSSFVNTKVSSIDYLSLGAGIVKSETYSDKGDLMGYMILTKLVKL